MSFATARECFQENLSLLPQSPQSREERLLWNLNAGLNNLAGALEDQLAALESRLARLESIQRR
jgi:hypothetical protein